MSLEIRALALVAIAFVGSVLLVAVPAAADEDRCGGGHPWVRLMVDGEPFRADFAASLLGDLRAGLREQEIEVCVDQGIGTAAAQITLRIASRFPLRVVIDLLDDVTRKRVVREVNLERIPEDGRPFALAVAAL